MPLARYVAQAHADGVLLQRVDAMVSLPVRRPQSRLRTKLLRIKSAAFRFLNEVTEA